MGAKPVNGGHAPPIPRRQTGEPVLGRRRAQIVPDGDLMLKKLGRHDGTDGVAPPVFRPRRATSIAVETREGLKPARLQLPAQYVSLDHASSIADENGATPRPGRKRRGPGETEAQWSHAWEDDGTESTVQSLIVSWSGLGPLRGPTRRSRTPGERRAQNFRFGRTPSTPACSTVGSSLVAGDSSPRRRRGLSSFDVTGETRLSPRMRGPL